MSPHHALDLAEPAPCASEHSPRTPNHPTARPRPHPLLPLPLSVSPASSAPERAAQRHLPRPGGGQALALCLCSKRFHALAEPVLYRTARATIRVGTCTSHLHSGARLSQLLQAPNLAACVTTLELALESDLSFPPPDRPLLLPPLPVLPNLRTLKLIYELKSNWCATSNWIQIFDALGPSVPQLVELDLRDAGFTCDHNSTGHAGARVMAEAYRRAFPCAKEVLSSCLEGEGGVSVYRL